MKRIAVVFLLLLVLVGGASSQQQAPIRLADTISVEAEGSYETDPDLATLHFVVSVQEKELAKAYDKANAALQRIFQLAERNGVAKQDISTGALLVTPQYDYSDKKRKTRAYRVDSQVRLKIREFAKIGSLLDEAISDEITEFRSLSYDLADEEAAKQRAVAEATKRAEGRAKAALDQRGQKLGALRYASIDVKLQQVLPQAIRYSVDGLVDLNEGVFARKRTAPPPPVPVSPEKIRITATVQCVFGLS